jgi:hypothetical protein
MTKARVNADNASADIQGVTAGTGLTGGGTSGTVTLTNDMATVIAAKGDLVAGTANDTYAALGVGANNTVLTADSAEATGLKWAAPSTSETWSLLNAGGTNLTAATTITVSGISGKSRILVIVSEASTVNVSSQIQLILNGDSSTLYNSWGTFIDKPTAYSAASIYGNPVPNNPNFVLGQLPSSIDTGKLTSSILLSNCNSTSYKIAQITGGGHETGVNGKMELSQGFYSGTSAVTSVSVISNSGNFDGGKVFIYAA